MRSPTVAREKPFGMPRWSLVVSRGVAGRWADPVAGVIARMESASGSGLRFRFGPRLGFGFGFGLV